MTDKGEVKKAAAKPAGAKSVKTKFSLPQELIDKLETYRASMEKKSKTRVTRSELIRAAIGRLLKDKPQNLAEYTKGK